MYNDKYIYNTAYEIIEERGITEYDDIYMTFIDDYGISISGSALVDAIQNCKYYGAD